MYAGGRMNMQEDAPVMGAAFMLCFHTCHAATFASEVKAKIISRTHKDQALERIYETCITLRNHVCDCVVGCDMTSRADISRTTVIIWSVWVIFDSSSAYYVPCAEDSNIWVFVLTAVIIVPVTGAIISVIQALFGRNVTLMIITSCIPFFTGTWGFLLWVNMSRDCEKYYDVHYSSLLLLFKITVILCVLSFITALCTICLLGGAMAAGYSQLNPSSDATYHDIPDSLDESDKQKSSSQEQPAGSSGVTEGYV
eukprot:765988-Hanusia_phi.AAC.13